jgi:2-C-methyl-D-erythritol 4-phosphate cytidylyltransferase/2-C-methyl-D-erythritol 2,4-cyclodiphosphate synthase
MHVAAIITAGGRGLRMGRALPKQFLAVGGQTILERSVAAFDRHQQVQELVIVVPPEALESAEFVKPATSKPVRFVAGGARRQDSVANGVDALSAEAQVVLVHDAARPCVSAELISRTIAAAASAGAAIAAVPVHDTVKQVVVQDGVGFIERTLPRETVFLAQTPQGFRREVLDAVVALGREAPDATDEASLAERAGYRVQVVPGDFDNLKITTEADLARVEGIVRQVDAPGEGGPGQASYANRMNEEHVAGAASMRPASKTPVMRIGLGYDLHVLVEGRPLILGGVLIPYERGLMGHSDADAVSHAVTDAVLGAANIGDIGKLFPDTDQAWKDANSLRLLADAWTRVRAAGFTLGNLDIVVIAQQPKIGPHADAIRESLARVLDVTPGQISIKGKTNERVDAVGRGEAIAVHAVALLVHA